MANRFWVAQPVSGAIVSVASAPQIRLTVSSTTGMTTGDVRTVSGVGGTTEANGTWTITVIDGTHVDLQGTTFTNVYTSGGIVVGKWDATNTNNWVTTSGGTNYGQTVPGSSDAVTFDGSSGGGTVTPNTTITVQSITCGAFTGTLAFNTNNNNVTLSASIAFTPSGAGTRTIDMGSGTWTFTTALAATVVDCATVTGLTATFSNAALVFTANSAAIRSISPGGQTWGALTVSANTSKGVFYIAAAGTFASITLGSGNSLMGGNGITVTVTGAITGTGSRDAPIGLLSGRGSVGITTFSVGSASVLNWCGVSSVTKAGAGTITASPGMDLGANTGVTITPQAQVIGS